MNWKSVKGFEDLYEVSDTGLVRSKDRVDASGHKRISIIRKQNIDKYGYSQVVLCKDGQIKSYRVHRLVAEAFLPNPDNKPEIDHIDTNPLNNNINNLRWVTHQENMNNSKTKPRMGKSCCRKILLQDTKGNTTFFNSVKDAVNKTKLSKSTISRSLKGKIIMNNKIRFEYVAA